MTLETNQEVSKGEYDPAEDPWYVHGPIVLVMISILLDRVVTVLFWELEANPIVSQLGIAQWGILSAVMIIGIAVSWYYLMCFEVRIVRCLVYFISVIHLLAAGTNIMYVFGFL